MKLYNEIVEFLASLPNIHDKGERRALIYSAGLDKELEAQLEFDGPTAQFCQLLVNTLERYGTLKDRRSALIALLETVKDRVGLEGKAYCDELLQQVQYPSHTELPKQSESALIDWGDAPDVSVFYGRASELAVLEQWIVTDRCRLVAILGMGGIGKTDFAIKLAQNIQETFEFVIWRKLLNAPPLKEILSDFIKIVSRQQEFDLSISLGKQITRLLEYLKAHRCLFILDNLETVLCGGDRSGRYREGYEDYGEFLQAVGKAAHQSCVVLTSREKPQEIGGLEGKMKPVRVLELSGLDPDDGRKLFEEIGDFSCSTEQWNTLVDFYHGNPLALELAARHIHEVFFGDIPAFFNEGQTVFADLRELLDWHFDRLSPLEKEVMYWLAIAREPVSLQELKEKLVAPESKNQLPSTLQSLQRRVPLEKTAICFTLQPVLIEYLTERLIDQVGDEMKIRTAEVAEYTTERLVEQLGAEITSGKITLLNTHALIEALAKDYIRESQTELILKPLAEKLLALFGIREELEAHLKQLLSTLRQKFPHQPGYAAGNILNLLIHLGSELNRFDFSHLTVWQAYLQGMELHDINFAHADLAKSVFIEVFSMIYSVAYSPDGKLVATGGSYGEIQVWQVMDGKPLLTMTSDGGWMTSISFSSDSRFLASGSWDQNVRLWDVSTGQCMNTFRGHTRAITSVAFSSNGYLASSSEDYTVKLWDINTGQCFKTLQEHTNVVWSIAFNADGTMLASGSQDETVKLWNVNSGQCLKTLQGHAMVWSVAFKPESDILAGSTNIVQLWNSRTGQVLKTMEGHTGVIRSIAFTSDGKILASADDDRTIRLWDVNTGQCVSMLRGHTSGIKSMAFSADAKILMSCSTDNTFKLWDVNTDQCMKTHRGYHGGIQSVVFSPCKNILASGSGDHTVRLWDATAGKCLSTLQGHTSVVRMVAFHPDGDMVVSSSDDQTVKLWDLKTKHCSKTFFNVSLGYAATPVAFSPNGDILVISTGLWDRHKQQYLKKVSQVPQSHTRKVVSVAFNPDGTMLATGSLDEKLKLWDIQTGQYLREFQGHNRGVYSIAFHPNGNILASSDGDYTVRLWDVHTGQCVHVLQTGGVGAVAFAPDGSLFGSGGSVVKLWETDAYQCINTLQKHSDWVSSIAFSPDSRNLASGSYDGTIRLWDVRSGKCLKTLQPDRPYERMNITGVTGLTEAEKANLKALGAIEE